jgi:hypothetical protein
MVRGIELTMKSYQSQICLSFFDLDIIVYQTTASVILDFLGKSNMRNPTEVLESVLGKYLEYAKQKRLTIKLSFSEIEYLNSSTLALLVRFGQTCDGGGIPLEMEYNGNLAWQVSAFGSLSFLQDMSKLVTISRKI